MSGVYIKGMEMPKNCDDCDFMEVHGEYGNAECPFGIFIRCASEKNPDCPLIPVPDHGRLIDADALDDTYEPLGIFSAGWTAAIKAVKETAPTIIPGEEVDNG